MRLSPPEGRVVGCLIEKQLTTPQQYPLTRNALVLACNQTSNREPVVGYADHEVRAALDGLKDRRLVRFVLPSHGRSVVRYRHVMGEVLGIDRPQLALLSLLFLRGPQTVAELRARAGRMLSVDTAPAVEHDLALLADRPDPLVARLARRPGQKEERWATLLADPPGPDPDAPPVGDELREAEGGSPRADWALLRGEVDALREETAALRAALAQLRDNLGG